jgi:hypothetical protein
LSSFVLVSVQERDKGRPATPSFRSGLPMPRATVQTKMNRLVELNCLFWHRFGG